MLDLCCFGFISALRVMSVLRYPTANSGTISTDMFGVLTPDAPIVAALVSHFGLEVGLITNGIGDEARGRRLRTVLQQAKIVTDINVSADNITPQTIVISDSQNNRTWFSYLPNVLGDLMSVNLALLPNSRLAYVDAYSIIQPASFRAIEFANRNNTPLFVNLGGDPLSDNLTELLRKGRIAIIKTSIDDVSRQSPERYVRSIRDALQAKVTVVTLGKHGAICATLSDTFFVPAFELPVIHNHGAGAAFCAGLAFAYLNDWNIQKSVRFASASGGLYCTVKDGIGKFSSQDVLDVMNSNA